MTRTTTFAAIAAALTLTPAGALAGHCGGGHWRPAPTPTPAPTVVRPIGWNPAPAPIARQWYFGMSLQITHTAYGQGLQVASVTPGSPAARAGLEPGDVLLAAGQVSLQNAYSNEHGVQLLQSAVGVGGAAPTAAVSPHVVPSGPQLVLTVVDIRSHQTTHVAIRPQHAGGPVPTYNAPAPSASTF